jgi:anti-sigma B factor antagonist
VHESTGGLPGPEQLLSVTLEHHDRAVVVIVEGEVDAFTVARLRTAVDRALADAGDRAVVVDLTEVTFLGTKAGPSTPLRVVVDHTRPVIRPLQLTGLDRTLSLYDYRHEALAADAPELPG